MPNRDTTTLLSFVNPVIKSVEGKQLLFTRLRKVGNLMPDRLKIVEEHHDGVSILFSHVREVSPWHECRIEYATGLGEDSTAKRPLHLIVGPFS